MPQIAPYETGMTIIYDVMTKCVVVTFRDQLKLIGPFSDKAAGVKAGEEFCRTKGWAG